MDPGINTAASDRVLSTAPAFAHRCKRLRHRQNECRICVEVCPEGAIKLDPGPLVSEDCTRCGLCQTACPTEVFQGEVHSDQCLLGRIGPLLAAAWRAAAVQGLFLHCREAEPQHRDSVAVPCLGAITGSFLLGATALGANPLTLVRGDCSSCRLRAGEALYGKASAAHRALASVFGLDGTALRMEQRPRNARGTSARRKFLARVLGQGEHGSPEWPAPGTDATRPCRDATEENGRPTPGRALLLGLLRGARWSSAPSLPYEADLPWGRMRIDQNNCATCGTCVNLCPTGAITRRIDGDRLSHHFSGALCLNCRLCQEACPQQVISFEPHFDARDLLRDEPRPITRIRLHGCEICGETLPEREGRYCITCQRRGRTETHAPGAAAAF